MSCIWVTGAAGYSGGYVLAELRRQAPDAQLVGIDVKAGDGVDADTTLALDLRDTDAVRALATDKPPSHVLHLAGALHPTPIDGLYAINVGCTTGLLTGIALAGTAKPRVVSVGSAAEYGVPQYTPIDEGHPTLPVNGYGQSKLAQSQLAESLCQRYGFESVIARSFNLIGPNTPATLVPGRIAEQLNDPAATEVQLGKTSPVRDFIDIRDAAAAYVTLLLNERASGTYNVCSGVGTSIAELLRVMIEASGRQIKTATDEAAVRSDEADVSIGSNARLVADTRWVPAHSLADSAQALLNTGA